MLRIDFPECQTNPNPSLSISLVGNIMIQKRRNECLMNRHTALQNAAQRMHDPQKKKEKNAI